MTLSQYTQRILHSDNGTIKDLTLSLNEFRSSDSILDFVAADDYLYIGSDKPFNHRFFDVSIVNEISSDVSVEIWWSNGWTDAIDVLDRTSVSGVSLAQDGIISWNTDRFKGWDVEQDSTDVVGLENSPLIYNFYWVRFKWSANITPTTAINYTGFKFANDSQLYPKYPDLNNTRLLSAFEAGKSDWEEQHFDAAEEIIADLVRRGVVWTPSQILIPEIFKEPAIHKAAEIIYGGMGQKFEKNMSIAANRYKSSMNMKFFKTDKNSNARPEKTETRFSTGYVTR